MPPRSKVSSDLKDRIPVLHHALGYNVKSICELLGVRKTLVYQTLQYHRIHGSTATPNARHLSGRPRRLTSTDITFIRCLLSRKHCLYLDEIQDQLLVHRGLRVSIPTLHRTLRRLLISRKCISARALERNDLLRAAFMNRIATEVPDPEMFMFIDESAKNERTTGRTRGWARVGHRCIQQRRFVRGQRYSILPVLTLDGIVAYDIIEGSVTAARFLEFLRDLVVSRNSSPHNLTSI